MIYLACLAVAVVFLGLCWVGWWFSESVNDSQPFYEDMSAVDWDLPRVPWGEH